jgi:hypothetical protein
VKRLIEEVEGLKSQCRHKDRDIALMNDKVIKGQGETDNWEREVKRVMKELSEARFDIESGERFK